MYSSIQYILEVSILSVPPGVADKAHVIQEKGEIYTAVLGLVDVVKGTNSFYKLQALEGDNNRQ